MHGRSRLKSPHVQLIPFALCLLASYPFGTTGELGVPTLFQIEPEAQP